MEHISGGLLNKSLTLFHRKSVKVNIETLIHF